MEVINRTLTSLLKSFVSKSLKDWDLKFPHVKFVYNRTPSYAIKHSPFEFVYGVNPLTPIDLLTIPMESRVCYEVELRAKEIEKLHK